MLRSIAANERFLICFWRKRLDDNECDVITGISVLRYERFLKISASTVSVSQDADFPDKNLEDGALFPGIAPPQPIPRCYPDWFLKWQREFIYDDESASEQHQTDALLHQGASHFRYYCPA